VNLMSDLRRHTLAPVGAILLPVYLAGCFQYVPGTLEPLPAPRSDVRVHLASPMDVPLGEATLRDVAVVEGIVAQSGGDSLGVFAKWLYPRLGRKYDALGATFNFSRGGISQVDQYRFSVKRTTLAVAIAGAVVVGFLEAVRLAQAGEGPPSDGGIPASVRGWGGVRD